MVLIPESPAHLSTFATGNNDDESTQVSRRHSGETCPYAQIMNAAFVYLMSHYSHVRVIFPFGRGKLTKDTLVQVLTNPIYRQHISMVGVFIYKKTSRQL